MSIIDRVLELLEKAKSDSAAPAAGEWTEKPLAAIIAHIVGTHHAYVRQETPRIGTLLAKVIGKHGAFASGD